MKYMEVAIGDLVELCIDNNAEDWFEHFNMGVDKETIIPILEQTDKDYGSSLVEEFNKLLESLDEE